MSKITLPAWYLPFETKLQQIYTLVRPKIGNLTVGGSAAIAYMLAQLNMMNELNVMIPPSDLDFMYNNSQISHPNFDNFTKSTESLEKSITYTDTRGLTFDLIFVSDKSPINKIALLQSHPSNLFPDQRCIYPNNLRNICATRVSDVTWVRIQGRGYKEMASKAYTCTPEIRVRRGRECCS